MIRVLCILSCQLEVSSAEPFDRMLNALNAGQVTAVLRPTSETQLTSENERADNISRRRIICSKYGLGSWAYH